MSQTLGHDGWPGARSCPPFNRPPLQVGRTPKPKTHVQTEALFITESATSWVLCSGICYSVSWGWICFYPFFGLFVCFFLAFSWLSSLSKTFEATSKCAMTFFHDGTWLKSASLQVNCDLESSCRLCVWMWAKQLIGVQSCCFVIIDFSFTKLSYTLCTHISFLTELHPMNSECRDGLTPVIY